MEWFDWVHQPQAWLALASLVAIEIVLGIDNIIFISILVARLPARQRNLARNLGLGVAMVSRLLLLTVLAWIMGLTAPLFTVLGREISGRDLILIVGGLFLLWKSVNEIHNSLEGIEHGGGAAAAVASFGAVLAQIAVIDVVFSLDSVITAVGMVSHVPVMVAAIVVAVLVMMLASGKISEFIDKHPSLKMLALSFLLVVGTVLIAESFDVHVPKGYVYFAMAFSLAVEAINIKLRGAMAKKKQQQDPVKLRKDVPGQ
jgi:predicted tellurium resistance membrane protein TerC